MKSSTVSCDFCKEFAGDKDNAFTRIYCQDLFGRMLFRSEGFVVVPSLGQLTEGHLLLLPTKHFTAVGDLPDTLLREFSVIIENVAANVATEFGPHVAFEHGVRSAGFGGCGIYHAHMHTVPLAQSQDPIDTLKQRFPYVELDHLIEINKRSTGLPSYLFYQDSDARLYLFDTGPLPSQYMRKLLADGLGEPNWNWRNAGREERLLATISRLSNRFKSESKSAYGAGS